MNRTAELGLVLTVALFTACGRTDHETDAPDEMASAHEEHDSELPFEAVATSSSTGSWCEYSYANNCGTPDSNHTSRISRSFSNSVLPHSAQIVPGGNSAAAGLANQ